LFYRNYSLNRCASDRIYYSYVKKLNPTGNLSLACKSVIILHELFVTH